MNVGDPSALNLCFVFWPCPTTQNPHALTWFLKNTPNFLFPSFLYPHLIKTPWIIPFFLFFSFFFFPNSMNIQIPIWVLHLPPPAQSMGTSRVHNHHPHVSHLKNNCMLLTMYFSQCSNLRFSCWVFQYNDFLLFFSRLVNRILAVQTMFMSHVLTCLVQCMVWS